MNEEELRSLLRQAAAKLGTSEEALLRGAQNGQLAQSLSSVQNSALQKALHDPEEARRLLSTPQAQALLRLLSKKSSP